MNYYSIIHAQELIYFNSTDAKCLKNEKTFIIFKVIGEGGGQGEGGGERVWLLVTPNPQPLRLWFNRNWRRRENGFISIFIRNFSSKITIQVKKLIICKNSEFSCSQVSFFLSFFIYLFMSSSGKCVENDNRL